MEFTKSNPSNVAPKGLPEREYTSMSLPSLKLAVPEIPGYHCHWMRGDAQRIHQAHQAGYEFVEKDEIELNRFSLAGDPSEEPGSDLGSRVSVYGDANGTRLYLMKLKDEIWERYEQQKAIGQERIAGQLRGDKGFVAPGDDASNRYSKSNNRNLFQPNRRA
ncbi:MAG TPA: hypothetical protein VN039_15815 [Nitrospira sp.]|nr:hypothetical protein [Nitrospira sp.]